jgi:hypothetical protein
MVFRQYVIDSSDSVWVSQLSLCIVGNARTKGCVFVGLYEALGRGELIPQTDKPTPRHSRRNLDTVLFIDRAFSTTYYWPSICIARTRGTEMSPVVYSSIAANSYESAFVCVKIRSVLP